MNAKRDGNHTPVVIAALNTDGKTPTLVEVTANLNALNVSNGLTGSDFGTINAQRDGNHVPVLIGVSATDGVTPVEVYCDNSGNLLVRST